MKVPDTQEEAEAARLRLLLAELYEWALDACYQGSGRPHGSSVEWHGYISTWEEADELLPRVRRELGR